METLVEVRDFRKVFVEGGWLFGKGRVSTHAVNGVSLSVSKGNTVGLVGESGCGKSTLGKGILRLVEPTSGHVTVEGQQVLSLSPRALRRFRRRMQMVFQDPYASLNPRMKVRELVEEPLVIHEPTLSKQDRRDKVREILTQVGLGADTMDRFPHEFSGGQRQRIGIARAIILRPSFVVCDEPVSALDVSIQSQIINLLKDLQDQFNLTYLLIAHDLRVVEYVSHVVAVMYLGRLMEVASSQELYRHPLHPYTLSLLSAVPVPQYGATKQRIVLKGDLPSPSHPPSGCVFHTRCPKAVDRCRGEIPNLREVAPGHQVACHLVE